jgi:hypothetical protein
VAREQGLKDVLSLNETEAIQAGTQRHSDSLYHIKTAMFRERRCYLPRTLAKEASIIDDASESQIFADDKKFTFTMDPRIRNGDWLSGKRAS